MPRTRSLAWSELKIGVLTILAIGIAAVLIFSLTGSRGFFWQRYNLKTRFPNVAGLASGSPVRLAGVEVGSVESVALTGEEVEVWFQVNTEYRNRITTDSVARLGSVSLLGEASVDITPATTGTPVPEWGYVRPGPTAAQLSDVTERAGEGIEELTGLLHDIRSGRGTVGKLMTDERLYAELQRFATTASDLTTGLREGRGSLGRLLNDRKTADALEQSVANIEALTRQINAGEGSLGKLLKDESFSRTLTAATTNLDTLTARLNRGEGTVGKLMTDEALFNRLNSVSNRFDQLLTRLNDGQGTAGQLLKDQQLYENMNGAVNEFRSLLGDIRKDPRRYLNVRVSIF
jgi:phospholipid/cholesterol/gamma-HCH transport system substrate-binding protein